MSTHYQSETGKTILFFIALARLTLVSLLDCCTMFIPLTLVVDTISIVKIEVYLHCFIHCFIESVSQRQLGKSTSRAEISSPNSLYFKAVKRLQIGPF